MNDFDNNGSDDIVLGYHQGNSVYPVRGRQCSSNQIGFVKEKFKPYNDYGSAELSHIYGDKLKEGIQYAVTNFSTALLINEGNTSFSFRILPNEVQLSSVNAVFIEDFDGDGLNDLVLLGNLYGSEVETPRNDASYGNFMKGYGKGEFKCIPTSKSGLWAQGDIKGASIIYIGEKTLNKKSLIMARNNNQLMIIKVN